METVCACLRDHFADRGIFLLPGTGLKYSNQSDHVCVRLLKCFLVHACHGRATLASVAIDVVLHLVDRGRLLRTLLVLCQSGRFGNDAISQCTGVFVALLDVRSGLVLPWIAC